MEPGEKPGRILNVSNLTFRQLMELHACTACGECVRWCPVYQQDSREEITARRKILTFRKMLAAQNSLRRKWINPESRLGRLLCRDFPSDREILSAAQAIYECSTCRQCHFVCPSSIDTVELFEALRRSLIDSGIPHIDTHLPMIASTKAYDNPWKQPRSQRARWTRVAEREGRIKKSPKVIKPPRDGKSPARNTGAQRVTDGGEKT